MKGNTYVMGRIDSQKVIDRGLADDEGSYCCGSGLSRAMDNGRNTFDWLWYFSFEQIRVNLYIIVGQPIGHPYMFTDKAGNVAPKDLETIAIF